MYEDEKYYIMIKKHIKKYINSVVEINNEKKSFKDLTLNKLKQYSNIGKIYITQIGDIVLQ